jgi:hypothetical protein
MLTLKSYPQICAINADPAHQFAITTFSVSTRVAWNVIDSILCKQQCQRQDTVGLAAHFDLFLDVDILRVELVLLGRLCRTKIFVL